jgi:hypothetical protein
MRTENPFAKKVIPTKSSVRTDNPFIVGKTSTTPTPTVTKSSVQYQPYKMQLGNVLKELPHATALVVSKAVRGTTNLIAGGFKKIGGSLGQIAFTQTPEYKTMLDYIAKGKMSQDEIAKVAPVFNKSTAQIIGEAGEAALDVITLGAGGVAVKGSDLTIKALAKQGAKTGLKIGAGYGLTSGLQQKDTNVGKVIGSTALGAGTGALAGAILNPLMSKLGTKIGGKTVKEIPEEQIKILDNLKLEPKLVQSRLSDIATKVERVQGISGEVSGVAKSELGKKILQIPTNDIDSAGQLFTRVEKVIKSDKSFKPEMLSETLNTIRDIFLLDKNEVNIFAKAKEIPEKVDEIQTLLTKISEAKPLQGKQREIISADLAKKFAKVSEMGKKTSGRQGFFARLGQLSGESEKLDFTPLKIAEDTVNKVHDKINNSFLNEGNKISAGKAFEKILVGKLPPKSEIAALEDAIGTGLTKELSAKMPLFKKIIYGTEQVLNIPRALMASGDVSFGGRQGIFAATYPKQYLPAFFKQFKALGSQKYYNRMQEGISQMETFPLMKRYGVDFTDLSSTMSKREEKFMSSWAEKIPVIGKIVRASNRAYTFMGNQLRANVFEYLAKSKGITKNPTELAGLAQYVNMLTGRGTMLKVLRPHAELLNTLLFSPKLLSSRINFLSPVFYSKLPPVVRKEAIKNLFKFTGGVLTALMLAKINGADIETNPTSSDFAKIKIGDTRIDITGGLSQYVRLAAQLISNKVKSTTTGGSYNLGVGYGKPSRKDVLYKFFEYKEAPVLSFVTQFLQNKNAMGQPFKVSQEALNRLYPLMVQDTVDALKEEGTMGLLYGLLSVLGFGVQTYLPKK